MKIGKKALIEDLMNRTEENLAELGQFRQLPAHVLNWREAEGRWSILECIEHLNLYGDFYLPEIEQRIKNAAPAPNEVTFRSGWLGNYFANSLLPRPQLNKMKTFKDKNPLGSRLDAGVLEKFARQQKQTLALLERARQLNLSKVKTNISISKWLKLRLGDTFRVLIYHNQRHLVQAKRVLEARQKEHELV